MCVCTPQEQLSQNKGEEVTQGKAVDDKDTSVLKKELDVSREQLKKLKSELLRKEYKHDTEMVFNHQSYIFFSMSPLTFFPLSLPNFSPEASVMMR